MESSSTKRTSMSKRDKRDAAVAELLTTEATYVSDMKLLVDVFVNPLEGWAADMEAMRESDANEVESRQPHLTHEDCRQIFANARQLAAFNRQFLSDLRRAHGGVPHWPSSLNAQNENSQQRKDGKSMASPAYREVMSWREGRRMSRGGSGNFGDDLNNDNTSGGYQAALPAPALTLPGTRSTGETMENDPFALTVREEDAGGRPGESEAMVAVDPDRGPRQMLEVFLKSAPFLKMYSVYVNNFDRARERLSKLERDNHAVAAFLTACERQRHCRGLRLPDFLIQPVQRIPRYRLLLETILLHTPIESSMHSKVQESLNAMGDIASKINADVTLQQQKNKVFELQQAFGGADFLSASRLFIREGDLVKVGRNGPERLHFVLFNDLLVYGQSKRMRSVLGGRGSGRGKQLYHRRREVNLHKCFIVDAPSYGTRYSSFLGETGLLIVSEEKSFVVMASSPVEKDGWLQAIRACMRDLALKTEAREKMCGNGDYDGDNPRSPVSSLGRSSRWSGSAHGPLGPLLAASAPRSVWVPGRDNSKSSRMIDFALPAWAGVRKTCGCLSFTELTWGKNGVGLRGSDVSGVAMPMGINPGLAAAFGSGIQLPTTRIPREIPLGGQENKAPSQISILVSISPTERLGLRLRNVHPGCGGGVVVVGFEPKSCAKRAGVQQGDRITRVDGVAAFKAADIAWALSQQYPAGVQNGRTVHLTITRGFPKNDKPWLPPLELAPMDRTLSSVSSDVVSPDSVESPPEVLSAPGSRTFSGRSGGGQRRHGFNADSFDEKDVRTIAAGGGEREGSGGAEGARKTSVFAQSLHFSGRDLGDSGSDLFFSDGDRDQVDDCGVGGTQKNMVDGSGGGSGTGGFGVGPAPTQANINAGGAPAKPLSTALPTALTACWTCQTDDPFQTSDEDARNNGEGKANKSADKSGWGKSLSSSGIQQKKMKKGPGGIAGLGIGSCVGTGSLEEKGETDDSGSDSEGSGSSASSLFLTAVSPSRVPPPLISMASTLPPPPVSMASSVEESFSNFSPGRTWYSPTASQAETPDNSMSWLKPLPPPPPRKDTVETPPAPTHSPPLPVRAGHARIYSGRWAQTPPLGEPKTSPSGDLKLEDAKGF